ncbi:MAG TPA: hypothetical protein PLE35_08485 [Lentisphaeria bacterium]|nr:hypothetical protein [Lentisphaeria bacterium]
MKKFKWLLAALLLLFLSASIYFGSGSLALWPLILAAAALVLV